MLGLLTFFSRNIEKTDRDFRKEEAERNSKKQEELNLALIDAQAQLDSTSMRKKFNIDLLIRAKDRLESTYNVYGECVMETIKAFADKPNYETEEDNSYNLSINFQKEKTKTSSILELIPGNEKIMEVWKKLSDSFFNDSKILIEFRNTEYKDLSDRDTKVLEFTTRDSFVDIKKLFVELSKIINEKVEKEIDI